MNSITSVNPANLEVLGRVPCSQPDEVTEAVCRAQAALPDWRATSFVDRAEQLLHIKALLLEQIDELTLLISHETGKPVAEVLVTEMFPALESLVYYAAHGAQLFQPQPINYEMRMLLYKRGNTFHEPSGVIALITPWSYPLAIPILQMASALIAGNTVVLKPSPLAPLLALRLSELLQQAEIPEGAVSVLIGEADVGSQLVRSEVDRIYFTGRTENGRDVMRAAADRLCPVTLQLSANDAMIVLDDANLERVVRGAVYGAFLNAGQGCASVSRVYVMRPIAEVFVERVVDATGNLRIGEPDDPDVEIGPLAREEHRMTVEHLVVDALQRGAHLRIGGKRYGETGYFYEPTVLTDVTAEMPIMCQETPGPVMPIQVIESAEEAVELANRSRHGLSASVWTADVTRAMDVSHALRTGTVTVNDVLFPLTTPECTWGGVGESGFGRTGGTEGLREMCRVKHLSFDTGKRLSMPWWYPYDEEYQDFMHLALLNQYSQDLRTRLRTGSELLPHWRRIVGQRRRRKEDRR